MTVIRWTEPASADFLGIVEWIEGKNPVAAARVGGGFLTPSRCCPITLTSENLAVRLTHAS